MIKIFLVFVGMTYLSQLNVIHRDLAARNCLIGDIKGRLIVKVADFGLARRVRSDKLYYRANLEKQLPFLWMPLEVLEGNNKITTKSDVWSYGVLMWELTTRGLIPYKDICSTQSEVKQLLKRGNRLPRPPYCPELIYSIMLSCWYKVPEERPTFAEVLTKMLEALRLLHLQETHKYVNMVEQSFATFHACPFDYNSPKIKTLIEDNFSAMHDKATQQYIIRSSRIEQNEVEMSTENEESAAPEPGLSTVE